jgi:hypothetical protein
MHVENEVDNQTPFVLPATSSLVDQPFLGGLIRQPATTMAMAWHRDRWIVDAGSCHGLPDDDSVRFAVHDVTPVREARLVGTSPGRSVVEPVDWSPDRGEVYPVVLSRVALPQVRLAVGGRPHDDPSVARGVLDALQTAGPGGRASPHLRVVRWSDESDLPDLVVGTQAPGEVRIETPDGTRLDAATPGSGDRVRGIVAQLEHIAVWRRIRALENPLSGLAGSVRVQIILPRPGEHRTPADRDGLGNTESGAIELAYRPQAGGMVAPVVFVRLDNTADRELFCVLLDLTDRFRIHANLFPGDFVKARTKVAAGQGRLIEFAFPPGRQLRGGASVRDWLMLIVSEDRIDAEHFALPRLGEPPLPADRAGIGLPGLIERLALTARLRDADVKPAVAHDWWTSVTNVITRVPSTPRG